MDNREYTQQGNRGEVGTVLCYLEADKCSGLALGWSCGLIVKLSVVEVEPCANLISKGTSGISGEGLGWLLEKVKTVTLIQAQT